MSGSVVGQRNHVDIIYQNGLLTVTLSGPYFLRSTEIHSGPDVHPEEMPVLFELPQARYLDKDSSSDPEAVDVTNVIMMLKSAKNGFRKGNTVYVYLLPHTDAQLEAEHLRNNLHREFTKGNIPLSVSVRPYRAA